MLNLVHFEKSTNALTEIKRFSSACREPPGGARRVQRASVTGSRAAGLNMQVGSDGRPPLPGQRFAAKSRSCKAAVPKGAAKRVVPRVPCSLNLQALVSQGFRLERREPFRISAFWKQAYPLRHGLRRATSPKVRGLGSTAKFSVLPRAPPLGELSNECETERARTLTKSMEQEV